MRTIMRAVILVSAVMLATGLSRAGTTSTRKVSAIVTSRENRTAYLAHATLWTDPGVLSPEQLLEGPPGVFPYTFQQATTPEGIECTFAKAGKELGGETPKFACATANGRSLRIKYWDAETGSGNREVFGMVAATRLLWALGFGAIPALPMNIRCLECPQNPMSGEGPRATRNYIAEMQASRAPGPLILSHVDRHEGWGWRDLNAAIDALPPGPERIRQRTHFDALTLLAVFMQHADQKREQHALYCDGAVDATAGDTRPWPDRTGQWMLFERPQTVSCDRATAMIVDAGSMFGKGARRIGSHNGATTKVNLQAWRGVRIFDGDTPDVCRGHLTIAFRARHGGQANPTVSEQGRQFLLEQLQRLTRAHVRALFTAARVDQLAPAPANTMATRPGNVIDEWVDAFEGKTQQIAAQRCRPAS